MTEVLEFSMWNGSSMIDLTDIVPSLAGADLTWHFLEFDGMGAPPSGTSWQEFDDAVRANGYRMSFLELTRFARSCKQTWDCMIVGLPTSAPQTREQLEHVDATMVIEAFDSSTWTIRSKEPTRLVGLAALLSSRGHPFKQVSE